MPALAAVQGHAMQREDGCEDGNEDVILNHFTEDQEPHSPGCG